MVSTEHHHVELAPRLKPVYLPAGAISAVRNVLIAIMAFGWVASLAGYFLESGAAHGEFGNRFFQSYLFAYTAITVVPLGAWFFVQVQYLSGSAWSVSVRRIMETILGILPLAAVLFLPVAFGVTQGHGGLYEWAHKGFHLPADKAAYLSPTAFFIRAAIYFAIWSLWSTRIRANSVAQDTNGDLKYMHANSKWSAPGLLVAMLTVSLMAFDFIMSLAPHWYSTIFGIYTFAGGAWSMFAILILICIGLQRNGILKNEITTEHYHDLGKWLFALTIFWTYIAFSQYMLIWYANLPEETIFFRMRLTGSWYWASMTLLYGHFIIPFLYLIFRAAKRNKTRLAVAAVWVIAMHLVDHYWLIMPNFYRDGIHFHWLDVTCLLAVFGTYGFAFWTLLSKSSILCVGDPRYEQGLHFHNV